MPAGKSCAGTIKPAVLAPQWNWLFVVPWYLGLGGQPEGEWIEGFGGKETEILGHDRRSGARPGVLSHLIPPAT